MPEELSDLYLEEKIMIILMTIKLFPNVNGFDSIVDSVKILVKDFSKKKIIYKEVAKISDVKREFIDSSVRNAIKTSLKNNELKKFEKTLGLKIDDRKPTPKEKKNFFALLQLATATIVAGEEIRAFLEIFLPRDI